MSLRPYVLIFISMALTFAASCKKEEGEGGTGTIQGKILIRHLDGTQSFDTTYYGSDQDVFIIYGDDHATYDDDFKTSFDGSYRFKFLQKGTYKIFAYSTDTTDLYLGLFNENRPKVAIFQTVEITEKNETVQVPDLVIIKYN